MNALDWMSQETIAEPIRKLGTLSVKIGFQDEWKEVAASILSAENGGSYFQNMALS